MSTPAASTRRAPGHAGARLGRLHVVVSPAPGDDAARICEAALAVGAPVIQVRAKHGSDRERLGIVEAHLRRCRETGATCIVNDRVDLAAAAGADGVHLGAEDLPVRAARALLGPDALVGATARDPASAAALAADGASYLGVGPIFASGTKRDLPRPIGTQALRQISDAVQVPVIAISGITAGRIPGVLEAGAHGVAVIGAVAQADDPEVATRALLAAVAGGP